jgi:hypothetical protein
MHVHFPHLHDFELPKLNEAPMANKNMATISQSSANPADCLHTALYAGAVLSAMALFLAG